MEAFRILFICSMIASVFGTDANETIQSPSFVIRFESVGPVSHAANAPRCDRYDYIWMEYNQCDYRIKFELIPCDESNKQVFHTYKFDAPDNYNQYTYIDLKPNEWPATNWNSSLPGSYYTMSYFEQFNLRSYLNTTTSTANTTACAVRLKVTVFDRDHWWSRDDLLAQGAEEYSLDKLANSDQPQSIDLQSKLWVKYRFFMFGKLPDGPW